MRFVKLSFQAFGSYAGTEMIDFAPLAAKGLFVVTGPTGTGKTTVFDALVYALYGELPGQRSEGNQNPRSHYAMAGTPTTVDLYFEANGVHYHVMREPAQTVVGKRGGEIDQQARAMLLQRDGDAWTTIADKVRSVNERCEQLVGLKADQFQRVVLLPQGKFNQFLVAKDAECQELLLQLFEADIYQRATKALVDRSTSLGKERGKAEERVGAAHEAATAELRTLRLEWAAELGIDPTNDDAVFQAGHPDLHHTLQRAVDELDPMLVLAERARTETRKAADVARNELDEANTAIQHFDDREAALKRRSELEHVRSDRELGWQRAQRSATVRPAYDEISQRDKLSSSVDRIATEYNDVATAVRNAAGALALSTATLDALLLAASIEAHRNRINSQRQTLEAANSASTGVTAARARLERADDDLHSKEEAAIAARELVERANDEMNNLRAVANNLAPAKVALDTADAMLALRDQFDQHEGRRAVAASECERLKSLAIDLATRYFKGAAESLATELVEGEPCRVCGSTHHPNPARREGGSDSVDYAAVTEARDALTTAETEHTRIVTTLDHIRSQLGHNVDRTHAELAAEQNACLIEWQRCTKADERLGRLEQDRSSNDTHLQSMIEAVAHAREERAAIAALLDTAIAALDEATAACVGIDTTAIERESSLLNDLEALVKPLATAEEALAKARQSATDSHERVERALTEAGVTEAECSELVLARDDEQQFTKLYDEWREQLARLEGEEERLAKLDIPNIRPDAESARRLSNDAAARAADAARVHDFTNDRLERARRHLEQASEYVADVSRLQHEYRQALLIARVCNGEEGIKVSLLRWVLGAELDRVCIHANVHLARMTDGRYQLRRAEGGSRTLALEVLDAATGRGRTTSSLSGGEQFQASLALALGLADVISMGGSASGKSFDALFIDEGFGSLDAAALDEAIDTLRQLHASGRMVGAITHVEAMKTELPVGIEVTRRADGRGSTLKVLA